MANRPRSQWGDDERADVGARHRTPRAGVAVPVEIADEPATGVHEGEELRAIRERRPTPHRIRKLEAFKDDMLERFPKVEGNVQWLVDAKKEEQRLRDESRKFRRAVALKILGGVFSGGFLVAVLHALGVL